MDWRIATVNMWKWFSSGSNISNNDLWRSHNRGLHGCLLLDRHMCEIPVYLEVKCDRKRDVLCQRRKNHNCRNNYRINVKYMIRINLFAQLYIILFNICVINF